MSDMRDRQKSIEFHRNYCCHYERGKGADMICKAGQDIKSIQNVPTGTKGYKWGPCIEGHMLPDPTNHCPKWERRSLESAEKYADGVEKSLRMLTQVEPLISAWRKKLPIGKAEIVPCPVCNAQLHLSQAAYNGHVWARCSTKDCVNFVE